VSCGLHELKGLQAYCTVKISECRNNFGEVPAVRAMMEKIKATISSTSMLIKKVGREVNGLAGCIVSEESIKLSSGIELSSCDMRDIFMESSYPLQGHR